MIIMNKLPNIIIIVLDNCGSKHMSLYGYRRKTTPNIGRIAEECVVYNNCFSPAIWTTPSHASLFTGLYPTEHKADGSAWDKYYLDGNLNLLQQVLKDLGYITIGISSNYLISTQMGFNRGFTKFYDMEIPYLFKDELILPSFKTNLERLFYIIKQLLNIENAKPAVYRLLNALYRKYKSSRGITVSENSAIFTVKATNLFKTILTDLHKQDSPFFIFINYMETHDKYNPPSKFRHRFGKYSDRDIKTQPSISDIYKNNVPEESINLLIDLYDEEILFIDEIIGDIYSYLKTFKSFENTLFILTSDHGEAFGEHGHFGHNTSVFNENIQVPLLIKFPKDCHIFPSFNNELVQTHDLYATIMDILNSPYPIPDSSISLITGQRKYALSQSISSTFQKGLDIDVSNTNQFALINNDFYKLIYINNWESMLFDLRKGKGEMKNVNDLELKGKLIDKLKLLSEVYNFMHLMGKK